MMLRLRSWVVLCHVVVRPLRSDIPTNAGQPGIATRVMTADDLQRAQASSPEHFQPDFVAAAAARGDRCVGAFDGDRVVSYFWMSFTTAPVGAGLWVRIRPPFRYGYKSFTDPGYRGRKLLDSVALPGDEHCRAQGYTHNISYIETHNMASVTSSLRRGTVFVGYAGWLNVFGRAWPFRSPGARRHGFSFYRPVQDPRSGLFH
jgi:hypothetical protein